MSRALRVVEDVSLPRASFLLRHHPGVLTPAATKKTMLVEEEVSLPPKTFLDLKEPLSEDAEFMAVKDLEVLFGGGK